MTFLQRLWERWTVNQIGSDAWMRSRGFHKSTEEELATARRLNAIVDSKDPEPKESRQTLILTARAPSIHSHVHPINNDPPSTDTPNESNQRD